MSLDIILYVKLLPCEARVSRRRAGAEHGRASCGRMTCQVSCVTKPNWLVVSWAFSGYVMVWVQVKVRLRVRG